MKLIRVGEPGKEKPGVLYNNEYLDLSTVLDDYNENFFSTGALDKLSAILSSKASFLPKLDPTIRLGPPIARPSKIVCIGLNYADHAKETGASIPEEPVVFLKSTTAIIGPNDAIVIPQGATKLDWEVELAVVIGKRASYVDEKKADDFIAGYCLHNDVSERAFQLERGGSWDKGKGCDTFAPLGPWLVTKDELNNTDLLQLWLRVNGCLRQTGNTSNLIFKIPFLISYVSQFMTLLPGDIISTGTPAGVGMGLNPPTYLQEGDVVELGIEGLGTAKQKVIKRQ